jgi:DNA-binding transcriptional MerR regulator
LPVPRRSDANYRDYRPEHVERLHFIRRCRSLYMSLDNVQTLLAFRDASDRPCGGVNALADYNIDEIERKLAAFHLQRGELAQLPGECNSTRRAGECEILRRLNGTHVAN